MMFRPTVAYCNHPSPPQYGFRSYISAPIKLVDGAIWGMLCAIDPEPRDLDRPEVVSTFELFGELIAAQLSMKTRFEQSQSDLSISEFQPAHERAWSPVGRREPPA